MPAGFDKCRAQGGKIRTKTLSGGRYLHFCVDKNGKTHPGYVKKKQGSKK